MTDREVIIGILETLSEDLEDTNRQEQKHCLDLAIRMLKECEERPQGKWIEMTDGRGHSSYFCSRCGTQEGKAKSVCPNCNADMREAE